MNRKKYSASLILFFAFCMVIGLYIRTYAIPAFARKYKTSCSTCHEAVSKRNAFGEAFRRNGYLLPIEDAQKVKEKPIKLGAEEWKDMWPEAIWPGQLPETIPVSAYTDLRINDNPTKPRGQQFEFNMPRDLVILFGGAFGQDVSFFGEWAAYMEGINAAGLFRLFFQFNNIAGDENLFNLRVGKFEPGITDGYTNTQKITLSQPATLRYDATGSWKAGNSQSGIEANGILHHRVYYAVGVVNGESKSLNDGTDQKDIYTRVAYMLSGLGFDGKDTSAASMSLNDVDKTLTFGVYGYWGSRNNIPKNNLTYDNRFNRYGADITWRYNKTQILSGIILGTDNNPDNDAKSLKSYATFIEGNYAIYPWLIGILRLEKFASWKAGDDKDKFICIIPNITMLYRANIRFSLETLISLNNDKIVGGKTIDAVNSRPVQLITANALIAF